MSAYTVEFIEVFRGEGVGRGGGGKGGGGKGGGGYTGVGTPEKIIQTPYGLYTALTDYTKPQQGYTKHQKHYTKLLHIRQNPKHIKHIHERLNKYINK